MKLMRMFSNDSYKGTRNYINSQKKYEIMRTIIYFGISLSLFISGWITTSSKLNLLTVVAILGCLPASKSMVQMIMFLRYQSLRSDYADTVSVYSNQLVCLYDMVFTSYEKNYRIGHMAVKGNTIIGFTEDSDFDEKGFSIHISQILKNDNHKSVTLKIFKEFHKYTERLEQLSKLDIENDNTQSITGTLKGVSL